MHERPSYAVDEAIRRRRSVRGFLPDEVPEATLREVFELAQWAPSNCNVQPWTPHVVSGEALTRLREALVDAGMRDEPIKPDLAGGPQVRRRLSRAAGRRGAAALWRDGRRAARPRRRARWPMSAITPVFDAPQRSSSSCRSRSTTREATDIGMYAQTLMLALDRARHRLLRAGRAEPVSRHRARATRRARQTRNCCSASRSATRTRSVKANAARVGRARTR